MSNVLGKSETKSLNKSDTKNLAAEEKKKLGVSETRGKKMKYSYNVNDPENALVMKLKDCLLYTSDTAIFTDVVYYAF